MLTPSPSSLLLLSTQYFDVGATALGIVRGWSDSLLMSQIVGRGIGDDEDHDCRVADYPAGRSQLK